MKRFLFTGLFVIAVILTAGSTFGATYDATGTWSFSISNLWVDTGNVPGCTTQTFDEDTTVVTQTGDTFTITVMGRTVQGTVSGSTYSASDSYPESGGTATLSVDITLSSETSGTGTLTWVWQLLGFLSCNGGNDLAIEKPDNGNDNPDPPESTVKLVFIHHSTGGNWLADPNSDQPYGGLGTALMNNNYYVSATNYGWGTDSIGDRTDIPNWPEWFTGSNSSTILNELYNENGQNFSDYGSWSRLSDDPGGENEIVMFKSCFPNSDLFGNPDDQPASEPDWKFSVSNAKAVYNNILGYFKTRQDKLFIVITAPPQAENEYSQDYQTPSQRAANARSFNNWLLNDWLNSYSYNNVGVFDYYNILTDPDNHHRISGGQPEHIITNEYNFAAYPTNEWDSHPNSEGHQKATEEFIPMLNYFYNKWADSAVYPERTIISGKVLYNETPLCAMVLANGQYMFSCGENEGIYEMDIPLDENGMLTLFCFVDGFAPFSQELTWEQGANFDINMSLASPDYPRMVLNPETEPIAGTGRFKISGTVAGEGGTKLCAMALANGQHVFSCGENTGAYELDVPLNTDGEIVLFGFVDGFQPYSYTFKP
ncbi:MAG: hypothetical protein GY795_05730 [Desulfobacterales bacterium]|nr:hypothetical protein [Desulfobacterales bacterium]